MIIGIFPKDVRISWESHLFGVVVGLGVAFLETFTTKKPEEIELSNISTTYSSDMNEFYQDTHYFNITYISDQQSSVDDKPEK